MASGIYDVFKGDLMEKQVDIGDGGDTIQVALLDDSHSFTSSDATWSDVNANEISGTGYTASGATLAGQTVTEGATTKFDGTDTTWTTASFTAYSLICSIDFGGAKTVSAGTFTIQWNANGIITLATA